MDEIYPRQVAWRSKMIRYLARVTASTTRTISRSTRCEVGMQSSGLSIHGLALYAESAMTAGLVGAYRWRMSDVHHNA